MSQLDDDDDVRLDLTCLSEPLSNPISALPDIHRAMSFIYVGILQEVNKKSRPFKNNLISTKLCLSSRYYKKNNKKSRPLKNNLISTSSSLFSRITLQEQRKNQDLLNGSAHCHG